MSELSGKPVLVTGADRSIGRHLVELLVVQGARAFVFYNSWNEIGWLRDLPTDTLREVEILFSPGKYSL